MPADVKFGVQGPIYPPAADALAVSHAPLDVDA